MYTKIQFLEELKHQCDDYDIVRTARWAHRVFIEHCQNLEEGLQPFVMKVVSMEEGDEFELSKEELIGEAERALK